MRRCGRIANHVIQTPSAAAPETPRGCELPQASGSAAAVRGSAGALCCGALPCAALLPSADARLGAGPDDIPVPTYHKSPRFELGDPAAHAYLEDEGYVSSSPFLSALLLSP